MQTQKDTEILNGTNEIACLKRAIEQSNSSLSEKDAELKGLRSQNDELQVRIERTSKCASELIMTETTSTLFV